MAERDGHYEWGELVDDLRDTRRTVADLWRGRPVFRRERTPLRNPEEVFEERMTTGQRIADSVAATMGSWRFIIIQSCLLAIWVALNATAWIRHWDPYPFILLNLALSFQAAYAAPIIMMSQNRQALKDRFAAQHDLEINVRAEDEIRTILQHLEYQDGLILRLLGQIERNEGALLPAAPPNAAIPPTGAAGAS